MGEDDAMVMSERGRFATARVSLKLAVIPRTKKVRTKGNDDLFCGLAFVG